jgi:hypothetical protein
MTEGERRTLRADLVLAFQESEVVARDRIHGDRWVWSTATEPESVRMADLVLAVLDEHGLDVVEVPGASRTEREAEELAASYRVTDAGGQLIEVGSPVRYPDGHEGLFEGVVPPECVTVDGVVWASAQFGLTVIPVLRAELAHREQ